MAEEPDDDARVPRWVLALAIIGVTALLSAYAWLRTSRHLEWHAYIGTSLEPVTGALTLAAVVAALWSVHVQRRDLALQRQELRDNREEMKAQREQFERTAKAQERLAAAEEELAQVEGKAFHQQAQQLERQAEANKLQRLNVVATVAASMIDVSSAIIASETGGRSNTRAAVQNQRLMYISIAETALEGAMPNLPGDISLAKALGKAGDQ